VRVSEGMVRCGTCRERFQARFADEKVATPRFDPRDVFIEPLSDEIDSEISNSESANNIVFVDPDDGSTSNIQLTSFEDNMSNSINSDLSLDIDDEAPITPVDSSKLSAEAMLRNIRAKQAREKEEKELAKQHEMNLALSESGQEIKLRTFEDIPSENLSEINKDEQSVSIKKAHKQIVNSN